jgi:hypothetical protein
MTTITIVGFSVSKKKSEFYRNYSSFETAEKGFSECLRNPEVRIISVRRLMKNEVR